MSGSDLDDATLAAAGVPEASLRRGTEFAGRYRVEREIGRGGMGAVYAAYDRELGETIALKILQAPAGVKDSVLERFRREVRLARRVTHHNVARTYDIGEAGGNHYLTMEYVDGASLSSVLTAEGPMPIVRTIDVAVQVCRALAEAHRAGVVHRDLKPANVMLEPGGRVVVTDFGIARSTLDEPSITAEGAPLVGTPIYMAPEQVTGATLGPQTDLYALGLIIYEMLTGRRAFERDTAVATAVARLHEDPTAPSDFVQIPGQLEALILSCLARDPGDRPASAMEIIPRLSACVSPGDLPRVPYDGNTAPAATPSVPTRSFVSANLGGPGIAVLPFMYRGPTDESYVAEALTDELIDLLSMTKGLRVPAVGATARFADQRDPVVVGRALSVDAVVDGTVQRLGSRVRVSARLIDASSGIQTWSERVDGELDDLFDLQDRLARRIAESLRLQLHMDGYRGHISPEAVDLYLRARKQVRAFDMARDGPEGAVVLFERCLELAPDFAPALTGYAIACARMWFVRPHRSDEDWPTKCSTAVARALEMAPNLPEAHIAAARMYLQRVEFPRAAQALARALELAPTCAPAHALLGTLQLETGRPDEGVRHVELAAELDPSNRQAMLLVAKYAALRGRWDEVDRLFELIEREMPYTGRTFTYIRMRASVWRGDFEAVRRIQRACSPTAGTETTAVWLLASGYLGEVGPDDVDARLGEAFPDEPSTRLSALVHQLVAEALATNGHVDAAMVHLQHALDLGLVDLDWLRWCPCLDPLRQRPDFVAVEGEVRRRANAIWSVS